MFVSNQFIELLALKTVLINNSKRIDLRKKILNNNFLINVCNSV